MLKRSGFLTRCPQRVDRRCKRRPHPRARPSTKPALRRAGDGRRPGARDRELPGRQRRPQHGRAVLDAAVLQVSPDDRHSGERRHAAQRASRLQSEAGVAQGHVRQRHGRDRSRRRLSAARPLAFPLDGDLANGGPGQVRAHRLARALPRRRRAAQRQPLQRRRARHGVARSADRGEGRRAGDRRHRRLRFVQRQERCQPRGVQFAREGYEGSVLIAVSARGCRDRRSCAARFGRTSEADRRLHAEPARIRQRRWGAAWRWRRRSSAAVWARASSTCSTVRSTRTSSSVPHKTVCWRNSATA